MEEQVKRLVPGHRRTAHQSVVDTLRRAILSGVLPGGSHLVQADIAEQLQVSTTPVREALRDLAAEGLIRLDAHRGAVVHECSVGEMEEIYGLRRILEPEAIRRALERVTDAELDRAEGILKDMESEDDFGTWVDLNREFHALIEDASGSPRLAAILKSLRDISALYVGLSIQTDARDFQSANAEHRAILEACRARDQQRAVEVVLRHLEVTRHAIREENVSLGGVPKAV
jgi:DNA-binding GntR family transcriptional regulator